MRYPLGHGEWPKKFVLRKSQQHRGGLASHRPWKQLSDLLTATARTGRMVALALLLILVLLPAMLAAQAAGTALNHQTSRAWGLGTIGRRRPRWSTPTRRRAW